ncbi:MAG TPA: thioredoxin family protein [Candidatus Dormibacteraeota bacterium]|jgi:thioredoxin-like negative regulator of GroEL|nr:thioredoxin family protein [Candidatus Dormibacteraeota bacterium]
MSVQLWALVVAGIVVLAAAGLEIFRSARARRLAAGATSGPAQEPYILYFTGDGCTVCRTHQEPALAKLGGVRVDKVDAIVERELADRFHVYTLPTTVVMSAEGRALHVNYGYAPSNKLGRQLTEARNGSTMERTATA